MDVNQVFGLISYCRSLDPRVGNRDADEMAMAVKAWHNALPVDMTATEAQAIVHELHAAGAALTPGAIGRRYDELHTPLHQQGVTRAKRPIDTPKHQAVAAAPLPEIGRGSVDEPVGKGTTALLDRLGIVRTSSPMRVPCPHCVAAPGKPCTVSGMPMRMANAHPSRVEAAAAAC